MTIEELKEIIFQNRCVFLNTKQPCLSDDMSAYGCKECSDKIVDEVVEKIRAEERERCAELLVNKCHSDSFYKESYKKDYLLLFNEKEQK